MVGFFFSFLHSEFGRPIAEPCTHLPTTDPPIPPHLYILSSYSLTRKKLWILTPLVSVLVAGKYRCFHIKCFITYILKITTNIKWSEVIFVNLEIKSFLVTMLNSQQIILDQVVYKLIWSSVFPSSLYITHFI